MTAVSKMSRFILFIAASMFGLFLLPACWADGDDEAEEGELGSDCSDDGDCRAGLECDTDTKKCVGAEHEGGDGDTLGEGGGGGAPNGGSSGGDDDTDEESGNDDAAGDDDQTTGLECAGSNMCLSNTDCTQYQTCDQDLWACVNDHCHCTGCTGDDYCNESTGKCGDESSGESCVSDADCVVYGLNYLCFDGVCASSGYCTKDGDCNPIGNGVQGRCGATSGICVECLYDEDCPIGLSCLTPAYICQ
jgi:hypothetical protein